MFLNLLQAALLVFRTSAKTLTIYMANFCCWAHSPSIDRFYPGKIQVQHNISSFKMHMAQSKIKTYLYLVWRQTSVAYWLCLLCGSIDIEDHSCKHLRTFIDNNCLISCSCFYYITSCSISWHLQRSHNIFTDKA